MALEKVVTEDKIEIVGEYKAVQVRTCTKVMEDGVELSSGYHRHVITAGQDYSGESAEVQAICAAVHTAEVIAAFEASQEETHHDNSTWQISTMERTLSRRWRSRMWPTGELRQLTVTSQLLATALLASHQILLAQTTFLTTVSLKK